MIEPERLVGIELLLFLLVSILAATLKSLRLLSILSRGTDTGGTCMSFSTVILTL